MDAPPSKPFQSNARESQGKWWQLRLRNLLAAMALFGIALVVGGAWYGNQDFNTSLVSWFAMWLLLGAALGTTFGHPAIGAFVGLVGAVLFFGIFAGLWGG